MSDSPHQLTVRLTVLPLPGLHLDSLGLCLSALGLLCLCARRWTAVRGGWRGAVFYLAGGPATEAELIEYVTGIGERGEWSSYQKEWDASQKADRGKGACKTLLWRSLRADEATLPLFQAHISPAARLSFNPLFGTGGNAGARDFSTGWSKATTAIRKPPKGWNRELLNADLKAFLVGDPGICLSDYNAGCWFGASNKAYNSGASKPGRTAREEPHDNPFWRSPSLYSAQPFREGQLSPWAMALACEAFGLFQGSSSRRLGSARRATGAFPFVTTGAAPTSEGEAGKNLGELWLPVWEQPMSLPEVIALFQRGRAEVNGRGATSSPAFAAAVLQRGVDAGIREFRRFLLLRTTSENTFESRLASVIPVLGAESATATALTRMLGLRDALPADRKKGKRWIYSGLRGPLDESLVAFAEKPSAETARATVNAMIEALRTADRNRGHRRSKSANPPRTPIRFQLLPGAWAASLIAPHGEDASAEARIGLALATMFAGKRTAEAKKDGAALFLPYWLGIQMTGPFCVMPEEVPFRRVWGAGTLTANMAAVLHRRLIEEEPSAEPPFGAWYRVALDDIEAWLSGALDDAEVERWAMRFSLFEWKRKTVDAVVDRLCKADAPESTSAELALFALFKPLFQRTLLSELLPEGSKREVAKVGPLPSIVAQLGRSDLSAPVRLARNAYRAAGIEPAKLPSEQFACAHPQRLLAALLIPSQGSRLLTLSQRWLSPRKQPQ